MPIPSARAAPPGRLVRGVASRGQSRTDIINGIFFADAAVGPIGRAG